MKKTRQIKKKLAEYFLKSVSAGLHRKAIDDPSFSAEEWRALLDLSAEHTLLPVVFESVYTLLPKDLEIEYRKTSVSLIADQVQRTNQFLRVYQELKKAGIEPLVIKGIICRSTYDLSDWRISSDEDIFIPRDDFPRFHQAMCRIGFQSSPPNYTSEHETVYRGGGITIEGHWELFPQETHQWMHMNSLAEDILRRAYHVDIDGVSILTPEPTDHMIFLLLHAMKHFALAGVGIRQICDIAMWGNKYKIDWARVKETTDSCGATHFTEAIIDAANRHFGLPVPEGWNLVDSTDLIQDALEGGVYGRSTEDRLHSASITSTSKGDNYFKFKNLLCAIFPNRKAMEINYPWVSKSPLLLPAGWCVRLLRYAISIIRKGVSPIRSIEIGRRRIRLLREYNVFQTGNRSKSDK